MWDVRRCSYIKATQGKLRGMKSDGLKNKVLCGGREEEKSHTSLKICVVSKFGCIRYNRLLAPGRRDPRAAANFGSNVSVSMTKDPSPRTSPLREMGTGLQREED